MEAKQEREPDHARLHRQLRGAFAVTYLTMLSIIQGVALADLAGVVAGGYDHFSPIQWLMVPMTFFTIITVWNHFMADSISMEWIPSFSDAVLPFAFGAVEITVNHTLLLGLPAWLLGVAAAAALEVVGTRFMDRKASQETQDKQLLRLFKSRVDGYIRHGLVGLVLFACLAALSWRAHVEVRGTITGTRAAIAVGILAIVFVWGGVAVLNAIQYWRDVVGYARSGRLPPSVAPTVHADVESPAPEPGGAPVGGG